MTEEKYYLKMTDEEFYNYFFQSASKLGENERLKKKFADKWYNMYMSLDIDKRIEFWLLVDEWNSVATAFKELESTL